MLRYIDIDKMKRWTEVDQQSCSREHCASTSYDCNECYYNNGGEEDVAPVVHSRWEELTDGGYLDPRMICSNCSNISTPLVSWKFCPNCGAKMDKE